MKVSVLIGSRDRPDTLYRSVDSVLAQEYRPLELLILDDNSNRHRLAELVRARFSDKRVHCFRTERSLGVAGGRNFLMRQAGGEIFCVLDDDAYFADDNCISRFVQAFQAYPQVGILASKIVDYGQDQESLKVPFTQRARQKHPALTEEIQLVSYYLGGGHAVHRRVIEQCGPYRNDLMFGEEELDLSYRAIAAGFEILYLPDVVVHHRPEPSVMNQDGKQRHLELYYHVRNRFFLAYKYLPWRYMPVYLIIWLGQYGLTAVKQSTLDQLFRGLVAGVKVTRSVNRSPLGAEAVQYLKAHYGRLWY